MKVKISNIIIYNLLLLLTLGCSFKQGKNNNVTIKGKLEGFDNATEVEDFSEFQYLVSPSSERIIVPDKNGNFNISFPISSPNYYRLGRNVLYLSPGDNMTIFINYANAKDAVFKGSEAVFNTYLKNTPFPHMGSYLNGDYDVTGKIENKIDTIEQLANTRKNELASVANMPDEFKRLETARIKADLINSLRYLAWPAKTDSSKIISDKKYIQSKINKLSNEFIDASLMKLVVYREIAGGLIKHTNNTHAHDVNSIKDWYAVSDLVDSMRQTSDKKQLALFKNEIAKIKTLPYKNATEKTLSKLLFFGKGDDASNFTAIDTNGKNVKLNDLKGKVIYIDVWATWCLPCMDEMPALEKIKEKYKENPNIIIVSLSIDNDNVTWKKTVQNHNLNGYQWRINRTELQTYNVVDIPRMFLIDKNFKMVNMNAPLPSQKALTSEIDKLLQ